MLARGFAVIRDAAGRPLAQAAAAQPGSRVDIEFQDGHVPATLGGTPEAGAKRPARPAKARGKDDARQSTLL